MNEPKQASVKNHQGGFFHRIELSGWLTIIGIIFLFSFSVVAVLIAPNFVDTTWVTPSSAYQVQMYEIEDPNIYISSASSGGANLVYVHHLKKDFTLMAFKENESLRIVAPDHLEKYITRFEEPVLKLTSQLLLLREPEGEMEKKGNAYQMELQREWEARARLGNTGEKLEKVRFQVMELYDPNKNEAFSYNPSEGFFQNWVDDSFYVIEDESKQPYHRDKGVVFVLNPIEFKIKTIRFGDVESWGYDPKGQSIQTVEELKTTKLNFHSRQELIAYGEQLYAWEGCWYCHTDQTRTLIQDVVLNGSDSYPAPPSSANEYIYQKITFPGTRRIGPDLSRVAIKRPSRDWHLSHFWDPKSASVGSIMPAFKHFFDFDPSGTGRSTRGIPNYSFESIYQYMMTKGSRITPPTQAWWLGKDPIQTKEIIEGQRKLQP